MPGLSERFSICLAGADFWCFFEGTFLLTNRVAIRALGLRFCVVKAILCASIFVCAAVFRDPIFEHFFGGQVSSSVRPKTAKKNKIFIAIERPPTYSSCSFDVVLKRSGP